VGNGAAPDRGPNPFLLPPLPMVAVVGVIIICLYAAAVAAGGWCCGVCSCVKSLLSARERWVEGVVVDVGTGVGITLG
jgi:hypothetical protein